MANLIVTDLCNLHCPYCFARDFLDTPQVGSAAHFIPLETFAKHLAFLARSGINEIRLIGGEPTLHPKFPELIALATAYQKPIVVFSHGLLSEPALACLETLPVGQCTILINMNAMRASGEVSVREQELRLTALQRLGTRALLGFNIFNTNFKLDFLLPLISTTGCRPSIRIGLAHPLLSEKNVYLHPKQYPFVGHKLADFAQTAARAGIRLEFDCGFVRCMFTPADLEILRRANADLGWRCNPILDLDLDGRAYHCFPLTNRVQAQLSDTAVALDLRTNMQEQTHLVRLVGIYKECSSCQFKLNGECQGGCLAHTLKRFQPAALRLRVPANNLNQLA